MTYEDRVRQRFSQQIGTDIKNLLETRHLYQFVDLDLGIIQSWNDAEISKYRNDHKRIVEARIGKANIAAMGMKWRITTEGFKLGRDHAIPVSLPPVNIPCKHPPCDNKRQAHRSGFDGEDHLYSLIDLASKKEDKGNCFIWEASSALDQIFRFPYQCQSCRGEPVVFLVRREGYRLTLVGRCPMAPVEVPTFIPKKRRKRYGEAVIANDTGFTLAGFLYLRTVVEQHMRLVTRTGTTDRIDGEALGEKYAKYLNPEFSSLAPSFRSVYVDLGELIHGDSDDSVKFTELKDRIDKHFRMQVDTPALDSPRPEESD